MEDKPGTDLELLDWAKDLLADGLEQRRPYEGIWWENIATYLGDLWCEWDPHTRGLIDRIPEEAKLDHRVRLPINLAMPLVRTEKAKITKNKPIIDVMSTTADQKDINSADYGDKVLNNYIEPVFAMPRKRRAMLDWALICGNGGIFIDYDPTSNQIKQLADPQGNPVFDERAIEGYKKWYKKRKKKPKYVMVPQGEMIVTVLSPFMTVRDFTKLEYEDAKWVIISDVYDTAEVERRWGVEVEGDEDIEPGVIEKRLLTRFDRTGKLQMKQPRSQDMCKVHRLFVRPGHPYFPNGLELVFTDQEVIDKQSFPYGHGELPVSIMGHISFPVGQHSLSVVQQVKPVVLEISRTVSQMVENRNLMTNPPWLIPEQTKMKQDIVNKPGLRLKYTYVPNIPEPHPVQMPDLPGYVRDLIPMMKEQVQDISGQGETSQGRVPPGARSGVAIAYLQEEDDTRIGPTIAEFEEVNERVANQQLWCLAENYDTPRLISIYKPHGEVESMDFVGSMLSGPNGMPKVKVQAGSGLPRSKAAKQQYILDLWDRGLEQDPRRVKDMLELGEGDPEDFQVDLDQAERENKDMMNGMPREVEEWFNHSAHHMMHRKYMKSAEFEGLNPDIQDIFRQHDEEHTMWEKKLQAELQQQQMTGALPSPPAMNGGPPAPADTANGMNVPEGPSGPFAGGSPRDLMDDQPQ